VLQCDAVLCCNMCAVRCNVLFCTVLVVLNYSNVAVYCSLMQFIAVCCSAFKCTTVLLQCVAVCCSVLQCVVLRGAWQR